ncbi:MAG: DUF3667 domain-containing protein, partial [Bacteroidetes bacterium]|nr:DUF3667 domain-containing protein [Bacteroidota bacterium]
MDRFSYLRQGDIGRTTLLRMAYTLATYFLGGAVMAGLAFVITLDVHDGGFGASFAETIQEHSVGVLLQAVGWAHVMLMATLGVCVRTFHRRTLRSVLAGPYIRWRRWGLGWLVAVVAVAGLWGMARAAGSAGSFPVDGSVVVIVLVSSLYAVSVEGFRGYLLQAISARCGAWRIGGRPIAPWLAAGAALLPTALPYLAIALDPTVPSPGASVLLLFAVGGGLLPALLIAMDDGVERAAALHAAVAGAIALAMVTGLTSQWAWTVIALVLLLSVTVVLAVRSGIASPRDLGRQWRRVFARDAVPDLASRRDETDECRNCGTPLKGRYCHLCGQRHQEQEPSIRLLVQRFFDHVFEVDSRIMRTLRLLCFAPGALSAHYFAGRRADFIPPIRLYLVSSFAFFLLFAAFVPDWMSQIESEEIDVQVHRSTVDSLYARQIPVDSLLPRAIYVARAADDSLPSPTDDSDVDRDEALQDSLAMALPEVLRDSVVIEEVRGDSLVVLEVQGLRESVVDAEQSRRGVGAGEVRLEVALRPATVDSLANGTLRPVGLVSRSTELRGASSAEPGSSPEAERWAERLRPVEDSLGVDIVVQAVRGDTSVVLNVPKSAILPSDEQVPGLDAGSTPTARGSAAQEGASESGAEQEGMDDAEALKTLLQNAAKVMFLLVPIFALILSFVYLHEPYAHHVV